ncbi:MAG TPA: hypothetical protein VM621_06010 [Luteibacter sp.]|uniref:hypothetical protein n=1 Tax=Luteibacter sp. TaxID=1886636 RepID=UPI002D105A04|nr:hypothetical protein [Luteibacter sp.]HVI54591.1 hypothetical protein [Luteibacter sp.]
MILGHLWDFLTSTWVADVLGAIGDAIRVIPYTLIFLLGFLIVQGLMACHASVDMGNGPAARALVHGAFLDSLGLWWSLGVPTALVAWKRLAKVTSRSRD